MNKQTFPIPEGCKVISMEIIDNQIITTFEPQFKRGDVLIFKNKYVFVLDMVLDNTYYYFVAYFKFVDEENGRIIFNSYANHPDFLESIRHATPEEAQILWDALAKEGKRWNPETMEVEEIKKEIPMAKLFEVYYFVESNSRRVIESSETKDSIDSERHRYGNYFLSKEQAQRAADKLKSALDEFWNEELK